MEVGVTGFIIDDAAQVVGTVDRLDRALTQRVFEERFTVRRMAEEYLEIHYRVIARQRPLLRAA